jgi:hypothetical protein
MILELIEGLIKNPESYEVLSGVFAGVIIKSFEIFYSHLSKREGLVGVKPTDISYFTVMK